MGKCSWGWVVLALACSSPRTLPDASSNPCDPTGFDPKNCGTCGHVCGANEICYGGACQGICSAGMSLCGTACFDLANDPSNCGACGKACNATHANVACVSGTCNITCRKNGADCDGDPKTGCEIDLATDSKNCGACGRDCLGGTCSAGKCQPLELAKGEGGAWAIAIDATNVYWTTLNTVRTCAKNNCVATTIASNQQMPRGITTDANNIYWTTTASVQVCAKNNCANPVVLATAQAPLGIASDGTDAYWAENGGGVIRRCAVSGCNIPTTLASPFQPYAVVVDKQNIFFTSQDGVRQVPLGGGTPQVVTYDVAYGLALDAANVYFTANGQVRKCAISGCGTPTVLASFGQAIALAVDATDVYWCAGNAIQKCAIGGCNDMATTLAASQFTPFAIAVDSTAMYWTNHGNGTIMRLAT